MQGFLPVLPVGDVFDLAGVAPAADDAVGGAGVDAEGGGGFGVGLAVEFGREGFEELALLESCSRGGCGSGGLEGFRFRESEEDVGVVTEYDLGDGHRAAVVGVEAAEFRKEAAVLHYPQSREYHRYAESDESKPSDGGHELVSAAVAVFGLPGGEGFVEVGGLRGREGEADTAGLFEDGVEVVEFRSEFAEAVVKCGVGAGAEHIVPDEAEVEEVEDEAAEETVLGIGDEVDNLPGCSCQERGEARILDIHVFTVLAPDVGDGLVVEGLAEAVGVVAVVGAEGVGEGVALGLEHKSGSAVVAEHLIDGCGGGVGRDEEHTHRRFFGFFHIHFLFAGGVVFGELLLVFHYFGLVDFAEAVVDGFDDVAAEGEAAFAGGCLGGDEEEQVRIDGAVGIDSGDVRQTGGDDGHCAED